MFKWPKLSLPANPLKKLDRVSRLGWIFFGFTIVLAAVAISLLWKPNQAAAWWNEAWSYRKKVVITNAGSAQTDYQVSFTLDTASLITAGKMQSDCDDLRVTDVNGVLLPHWVEENNPGCNSATTLVWVKVPTVNTTGTVIYTYYGSASAGNVENGNNVFAFFDDFNETALNGSKWSATGAYSQSSGELTITTGTVYSNSTVVSDAKNYMFESRSSWSATSAGYAGMHIADVQGTSSGNTAANKLIYYMTNNASLVVGVWAANGTVAGYNLVGGLTQYTATAATYYVDSYWMDNTNMYFFKDRTATNSYTGTWTAAPYLFFGQFMGSNSGTSDIRDMTLDWVLVRKYAASAPVAGSPGTEEVSEAPVAHWKFDEGTGTKVYSSTSSLAGSTTNLVVNPSFETGTTSWSLGVNGGTWTRISTGCAVGDYCLKGVTTTTSQASVISVGSLTPGSTITVTAYLKAEGGSSARFYVSDPGYVNPIYSGSVTSNYWVRSTASKVVPAAGAVNIVLYTNVIGTAYYDGIQLEVNSTNTPYCDGAQTGGGSYVWSGTAHGSTSTCNYTVDGDFGVGTAAPTWQTEDKCISGKCLLLDGSSDYVGVPPGASINFSETDSFTVSAWIKRSSTGTVDVIFGKQQNVTNEFFYGFNISATDKAEFGIGKQNVLATISTSTTTISENTWYFITGTFDGTSTRLYVNGKLEDTDTKGFSASTQSVATAYIGQAYNATGYFGGSVDDVKIYKYARTAAQIKTDYNLGAGNSGAGVSFAQPDNDFLNNGLVGYWPMDETAADSCPTASADSCDKSGNVSDGTWAGNATTTGLAKYGNAVIFDGNGDNVDIPDNDLYSINTTGKLTVSGWFNVNALAARQNLLSKAGGGYEWDFRLDTNGQLSAWIYTSAGDTVMAVGSAVSAISAGQWYHATMVVDLDKPELTFYVNGVAVGTSTTISGAYTNGPGALRFGERADGSGDVNGKIDEVRIYNRALASNEVKALYDWAPGPVAYWPMDENTETLTVMDRSGNNLTGTMNGTMTISDWVPGKFGSALDFDGSNDYVLSTGATPLQRTANSPWTIGGWYYIRNAPGDIATLAQVRSAGSSYGYYLSYGILTSTISSDYYGSGSYWRVRTTSDVTLNSWHHIAVVHDGTGYAGVKMYVDGVSVPVTTANAGTPPSVTWTDTRLAIGADEGASPLDGKADDVKIYNYARTPEQIVQDMNAGHPSVGSPVGSAQVHWKLDEGQGSTAYDQRGNANGSINGATWTNEGKFGKALNFNGSGNRFTFTSASAFSTAAGTVSLWLNSDQDQPNPAFAFSQPASATSSRIYMFFNGGNTLYTTLGATTVGSLPLTHGQWYHLVLTWDGTTSTMYVNGVDQTTNRTFSGMTSYVEPSIVGCQNNSGTQCFDGKLDEIKIYQYALSPAEVLVEFNQGKTAVLGAKSTENAGLSKWGDSRGYCPPGDTGTCNPPVAEYKLDENAGTTSVYDTSGNGNTGTMNGSMTADDWVPGKFGSALDFDGSNDYVAIPYKSDLMLLGNFTISSWIYSDTFPTGTSPTYRDTIYSARDPDSPNNGINLVISGESCSGEAKLLMFNGGASVFTTDCGVINEDQWHHIVATYDDDNNYMRVYIDGALSAEGSVDSDFADTGDPVRIGASAQGSYYFFDGNIDEVRIYNYARTPAQVAWEYNQGKPVAHYKFDECQGTVINDWSQNANGGFNGRNGTLTIGGAGNNQTVGTCSSGVSTEAWNNGTTGKFNASMSFGGTDDYVNVPGSFLYNEQTISFWAKADWTAAAGMPLSSLKWTSPGHDGFRFSLSGGNLTAAVYNNVYSTYSYAHVLSGSDWHQFTLTWTGSTTKSYLDGKLVNSATRTNLFATIPTDMDIGRYNYQDNSYFTGQIDEVKIFNYALTDEQVKLDYSNSAAVRFN